MNRLLSGSLYGALAGLLYGVFEYAAVILEPMLRWGPRSLGPEHWFWETVFLSVYVLLGAAAGAAAAALPNLDPRHASSRAALAAGIGLLAAGRIRSLGFASGEGGPDLVLLLLGAFVAAAIFASPSARWIAWMSSPWVVVPLLFAWIKTGAGPGGAVGMAVSLLALWAVAAAAVLAASRIGLLARALDGRFVPWTAGACAVLLAGMASLSVRLNAPPPLPAATRTAASGRPNVLLIVLDTVRADHLSVDGYRRRTTPNLEALARQSVLFRNAVSAADMTLSSYGAMYTGLIPSWHGALPNPAGKLSPLAASFHTLAETLSENGYTSMAVLANHGYLNREFGMQQGFQFYDVRPQVEQDGGHNYYYLRRAIEPLLNLAVCTSELGRIYRRSDEITDGALRLVASQRSGSAPFFLSLNYMGAHEPYSPPAPYRDLFPGRSKDFEHEPESEVRRELALHGRGPGTVAVLRHITSQYDGSIAFMDAQIKRLLDGVKQSGLYDNTLIIVTSDHGEALGERNDLGHPASVHQELVHVPLLVKFPRSLALPEGRQIDTPVSGIDLMPTILDVAGIPIPAELQGRSLRNPNADPERMIISESFVDAHLLRIHRRSDPGQRAVYRGSWKLIVTANRGRELYNWVTDPEEAHNLYTGDQPQARDLGTALDSLLRLAPHRKLNLRMNPETTERLRGLGYIE